MKRTHYILGTILTCGMAVSAFGQFGQPMQASDVLGLNINDAQDHKIGTVKDLAVDLQNGRIVEVIMGRGGFLGLDQTSVPVLPDNFSMAKDGKSLELNIDPQKLKNAPAVDFSKWKTGAAQPQVEQVYQYYGVTPYFLVEEHSPHATSPGVTPVLGTLWRASDLIGTETMDAQGEEIGKVGDLIVDLPSDRAVEVIIKSGRYLDMPGELSAVPPQRLSYNEGQQTLSLDITKPALAAAPHSSNDAWLRVDRHQATAVYQAYHVTPYFLAFGNDDTVQNAPPVNTKTITSRETGTSASDLDITAKIRKEIIDTPSLTADASNIKVSTVNGRVTLRGMVATMEEKRLVGEIAARIVPEADVQNELEVRETAFNAGT